MENEKTKKFKQTKYDVLRELAEENRTRKILEILKGCYDLDEAVKKVEALLYIKEL
ncbi:MAG: hypothetical protein LUD77_08675 [Clostridiales bacterium]|nr:hypothetical protein [Clostridiales bacterium]